MVPVLGPTDVSFCSSSVGERASDPFCASLDGADGSDFVEYGDGALDRGTKKRLNRRGKWASGGSRMTVCRRYDSCERRSPVRRQHQSKH